VHNNTKIAVLVVKYFTYLKHTALDRLQVRLNVILFCVRLDGICLSGNITITYLLTYLLSYLDVISELSTVRNGVLAVTLITASPHCGNADRCTCTQILASGTCHYNDDCIMH